MGPQRFRRFIRVITLLVTAALTSVPAARAAESNMQFFQIGTGASSGTYFPIGGMLAKAISHPHGSRACEAGGSCGVPNLIGVVQSTEGSVDNIRRMASGQLPSALVQGDVAYWAHTGTWLFEDSPPVPGLRAIANLFPEAIHIVVRATSDIRTVEDLKGRKVAVGAPGSGTRVDAQFILEAYGVGFDGVEKVQLNAGRAADRLRDGELDAVFFVGGTPASAITSLAETTAIRLIPVDGAQAVRLAHRYPYLARHTIPAEAYPGVDTTQTLAVGAQWIVRADLNDETVYALTKALWHPSNRSLLDTGHPKGRLIRKQTALDRLGVPLHPGARRYYADQGLLTDDGAKASN
ncbi:hypothetical protein SAMN05216241_105110 [Limimonas halophila]|uniref:TRAP transporter solute receptor, TAXI family n=2 Tax=Limimonas halophila TaxID=1082479 RepID=A0A1G7RF16_9PROT|nr:hypothetical protein SAMN05216241_105110 [Limimonas halophila]